MAELAVARTYGSALFEAAKELGRIEPIESELAEMLEIFKSDPEFMLFLSSPSISHDEKKEVLHDLFHGQLSGEFLNFMDILIEKGRMRRFEKIASVYTELVNAEEGITAGIIYSAVPLDAGRLEKFEKETSKLLKKNIRLENEIDKSLIGGVKIFADGKMIDASLRARVSALMDTIK
ncbi:MAG: ATP synthase F1 subunit delta [Firmicutes bacterium]|nr:ATP synthase F1 subunit delta [Bacillota bacterium]